MNCAGGMNNKAVFDDWRIKLLMPLLLLIDFLLKQRGIASALFNRVKDRHDSFNNLFDLLFLVEISNALMDELNTGRISRTS